MIKYNTSFQILVLSLLLTTLACNSQISPEKNEQSPSSSPQLLIDSTKTNQLVDDKKHGFWKMHHQNGQLKSEGYYILGLKDGLHKTWESDGVLSTEGFYKNGKANGLMKWYHGEGHLAGSGNMVDDIRHGRWRICDIENTGFCIDANFKNGKRSGTWKINYSNASDKIWKEQTWKDDKLVAEKCWDEAGKVIECEEL